MIKINKIIHLIFLNFLLTNVIYCSFSQYSFASVDRVRNTSGNNCEALDDSSCYAGVCDSDISTSEQEPCYVSNYNNQAQSCDVGSVSFNPFGNDIHWDLGNILRAGVGAVALFAFFVGLKSIAQGSFGKGDVLLAPLVGFALAYNSWQALLGGVVGIFLIGGVVSAALLFTGRVSRKSRIAFGPYIVVGTLLALVI
jgi:hypothetical protein